MPRYIDVDKAYDLARTDNNYSDFGRSMADLTSLRELLDDTPTADVAPVVHGKWILRHVGRGHYWECSNCHENPCIYVTENTKYCSNCGAKMDLED